MDKKPAPWAERAYRVGRLCDGCAAHRETSGVFFREARRAMGRTGQASIHAALDDFTTKLKRRQFPDSSVALARHTTETLIHAVAAQQSPTVEGIIEGVRAVSQKLVDARPLGARSPVSPRPSPASFSRAEGPRAGAHA